MDERRQAILDRALDGYFEGPTSRVVRRALTALDEDEVHDDRAVARFLGDLLTVVDERFGRDDEEWITAVRSFLEAEVARQVAELRRLDEQLPD